MEGYLMKRYYSRGPFSFSIYVLGLTIITTTVNKLVVTALQRILTTTFITADIFALVIPYLFAILLVLNKYYCLVKHLDAMITSISISPYNINDLI